MPIELAVFLLLLLSVHVVVGLFARRKGQSPVVYFALSLVLSPLIALVILAISSRSAPMAFVPVGGVPGPDGIVPPSQWSTATPRSRGWPIVILLAAAITVAAVVAFVRQVDGGILGVGGPEGSAEPLVDGLPSAGQIWFGTSYDADTFEVRGRINAAPINKKFVVVGQLPTVVDMSTLRLRISLNGMVEVDDPVGLTGDGDLFALDYTPPLRGIYRFELTLDGSVVAGGGIQVK